MKLKSFMEVRGIKSPSFLDPSNKFYNIFIFYSPPRKPIPKHKKHTSSNFTIETIHFSSQILFPKWSTTITPLTLDFFLAFQYYFAFKIIHNTLINSNLYNFIFFQILLKNLNQNFKINTGNLNQIQIGLHNLV